MTFDEADASGMTKAAWCEANKGKRLTDCHGQEAWYLFMSRGWGKERPIIDIDGRITGKVGHKGHGYWIVDVDESGLPTTKTNMPMVMVSDQTLQMMIERDMAEERQRGKAD